MEINKRFLVLADFTEEKLGRPVIICKKKGKRPLQVLSNSTAVLKLFDLCTLHAFYSHLWLYIFTYQ